MSVHSLTKIQKLALTKDEWAIHTKHKITEGGLTALLAERGLDYESKNNIFVRGKLIPVFITDFEITLYLASNRIEGPYSFEAYHRKNDKEEWVMWRENGKTPVQKLIKETITNGERVRGEALKAKKREHILLSRQRKAI